jgi:hypothetical protein
VTLPIAENDHEFTLHDCSLKPQLIFNIAANDENGVKASAGYVTIAESKPAINSLTVRIKPSTIIEASTPMAVYIQAVELVSK